MYKVNQKLDSVLGWVNLSKILKSNLHQRNGQAVVNALHSAGIIETGGDVPDIWEENDIEVIKAWYLEHIIDI